MKALFGLLAVLAGVSHGVGIYTYCDARQNGAQCHAALGGTVDLHLVTEASATYNYKLSKDIRRIIFKTKNGICIIDDSVKNRSSFTFGNGTFRMSNIERSDAAEYRFEIEDGGKISFNRIIMSTEAPVSSPRLFPVCRDGKQSVSCSSEGDSLQYSWTLDGQPLKDNTRNITLKRGVSGNLTCSVKNNVSSANASKIILPCEDLVFINCSLTNGSHISGWVFRNECITTTATPTTITPAKATTNGKDTASTMSSRPSTHITLFSKTTTRLVHISVPWYIKHIYVIAGSLAAVVLILLVFVGVYCAQMKKKATKNPDNEDDQDVTYADVRVLQGQQKQKERKAEMEVEYGEVRVSGTPRQREKAAEMEVEYGQVKVSGRPRQKETKAEMQVEYGQVKVSSRPRQTAEPSEDDCVYAKVHLGQRR